MVSYVKFVLHDTVAANCYNTRKQVGFCSQD